jgi:hypothetical protein
MKKLGSNLRLIAALLLLALVVAVTGFSANGYARGLVSKFNRMVSGRSRTGAESASGQSATSTRAATENSSEGTQCAGLSPQREMAARVRPFPTESRLIKADSFKRDLRDLPSEKPVLRERPESPPETPAEASGQASASVAVPGAPEPGARISAHSQERTP